MKGMDALDTEVLPPHSPQQAGYVPFVPGSRSEITRAPFGRGRGMVYGYEGIGKERGTKP